MLLTLVSPGCGKFSVRKRRIGKGVKRYERNKKKEKQNEVILGRATEGDNKTEDSSVYTENLDVNMT